MLSALKKRLLSSQILLISVFCCQFLAPYTLFAQKKPNTANEETSLLYRNEAYGYIMIHSSSWGLGFRKGKHLTGDKKLTWEIDAVGLKHPKEYKQSSFYDSGQSYVYGKDKGLLVIRTGYGLQNTLYNKADKTGVEIRYIVFGGLDWGILKPIYYDVTDNRGIITQHQFDSSLNQGNIFGKSSFFKGIGDMTLDPGVYVKGGFSFEYGSGDESFKAIELGFILDTFLKKAPIMAMIDNNRLFLSFYVSLSWGKKW